MGQAAALATLAYMHSMRRKELMRVVCAGTEVELVGPVEMKEVERQKEV